MSHLLLVTLLVVAITTALVSALAPITHPHRSNPDRMKWCGSADYDCVVVKEHGGGGLIKVDGLDLMTDTPDVLRKKLPDWFGPRPCKFVFEHRLLDEDRPMAHNGVELMNTLVIYEANVHQAEELAEREAERKEFEESGEEPEYEVEDEEPTSQSSALKHLKGRR